MRAVLHDNAARVLRLNLRSTTIGAWSDGPLPLRASRST